MVAITDEKLLELIIEAKAQIISGGSATISAMGHSRTFLSLDDLNKEQARLERKIAAKAGAGTAQARLL